MCAKHLFSIEHRNRRWLANREIHTANRIGRKLAQIRRPSLLALMADIHAAVDPIIDARREAEKRLDGILERTRAKNARCTGEKGIDYCGVFHPTAGKMAQCAYAGGADNQSGMEENEPLWTNGQALKERDEVRE